MNRGLIAEAAINETEEARDHSEKNWRMMLDGLKKLLENESERI
jgi:hypothetical protein